jgi:hypothetical protein
MEMRFLNGQKLIGRLTRAFSIATGLLKSNPRVGGIAPAFESQMQTDGLEKLPKSLRLLFASSFA